MCVCVCVCVCVGGTRVVQHLLRPNPGYAAVWCVCISISAVVYPVGDERVVLLYNGSTDLIHKMTQVQKS